MTHEILNAVLVVNDVGTYTEEPGPLKRLEIEIVIKHRGIVQTFRGEVAHDRGEEWEADILAGALLNSTDRQPGSVRIILQVDPE